MLPRLASVDIFDPENGDVFEAIVKNWNRRNKEIEQNNKKMQAASPLARPRPKINLIQALSGGHR